MLCYVAMMLMLFLLPLPQMPSAEAKHVDKLVHFGIFLGFALLYWIDQQQGMVGTFVVSTLFAGAIELVQRTLPYRQGDWLDFAVGALGAGFGAGVLWLTERMKQRRERL